MPSKQRVGGSNPSWLTIIKAGKRYFNVFVKNSATNETLAPEEGSDFTALKVTALLHQMTSGDGETSLESDADEWARTEATKLADEKLTNPAP